jgi:hypothetical protein
MAGRIPTIDLTHMHLSGRGVVVFFHTVAQVSLNGGMTPLLEGLTMRLITSIGLLAAGLTIPTVALAVDDTVVYSTKAECKAALAEARTEDSSYWSRECRPEGEGWSFRAKDRGDWSTKGMGN